MPTQSLPSAGPGSFKQYEAIFSESAVNLSTPFGSLSHFAVCYFSVPGRGTLKCSNDYWPPFIGTRACLMVGNRCINLMPHLSWGEDKGLGMMGRQMHDGSRAVYRHHGDPNNHHGDESLDGQILRYPV